MKKERKQLSTSKVLLMLLITFLLFAASIVGVVLTWNSAVVELKATAFIAMAICTYFFTRYLAIYYIKPHHLIVKSKWVAIKGIVKSPQFMIFFITGSKDKRGAENAQIFATLYPHGCDNHVIEYIIRNAHKAYADVKTADQIGNEGLNIIKGGAPVDPENE